MNETSKCRKKRLSAGHFDKYLRGRGVDIGCGNDKLVVESGEVDGWDVGDGDAAHMRSVADETYDFVYSSHCLEHVESVHDALFNWGRICKTGGYLYFVVPEFVLYEKMQFPSVWNYDHKQTFSFYITRAQVGRENHFHHSDVSAILSRLGFEVKVVELEDDGFDYDAGPQADQTRAGAMAHIMFVARKRETSPGGQHGADLWVLSRHQTGFFVDAGCFDGSYISNTNRLERLGWSGICIDAFPRNFSDRPRSKVVQAVLSSESGSEVEFTVSSIPEISGISSHMCDTGWEKFPNERVRLRTSRLQDILDEHGAPRFIEYLNLDIEGGELEVLSSFPFDRYQFGCISVEHNYRMERKSKIRSLLESHGYRLDREVETDDFYVLENSMKRIGLCMIVKDESKIIARCLDSVRPMIDYALVVDTGSSDDTIQVIEDWLRRNSIPGEVVSEPWRGFAHARSFALARLREKTHIDYALMIDADEVLRYEPGCDVRVFKRGMNKDLYNIRCRMGSIEYDRTSVTKNTKPFFYRGVVHEFLDCGEKIETRDVVPGLFNVPVQDSARNHDPQKYKKDAEALAEALKTETDKFMQSRYTFYLAQSLRDAGDNGASLHWYLRRAEMGMWDQEVYISLLQAARIKEQLEYPHDDVVQSYMRAHEVRPERIESLHGAVSFCRRNGRCEQAYLISKHALSMPVDNSGLFVEPWIWKFGMLDEFSISCYWTKRFSEGLEAANRLLELMPESDRQRIARNIEFLKKGLGSRG